MILFPLTIFLYGLWQFFCVFIRHYTTKGASAKYKNFGRYLLFEYAVIMAWSAANIDFAALFNLIG